MHSLKAKKVEALLRAGKKKVFYVEKLFYDEDYKQHMDGLTIDEEEAETHYPFSHPIKPSSITLFPLIDEVYVEAEDDYIIGQIENQRLFFDELEDWFDSLGEDFLGEDSEG